MGSFTVTLGTGASDEVVFTAASAGTTLSGTYTVSTGDSSADLNVSSFEVASGQSITDIYGNAMTSTSLPSGNNLADNSAWLMMRRCLRRRLQCGVQCNHWCFDVWVQILMGLVCLRRRYQELFGWRSFPGISMAIMKRPRM